MSLLPTPFRARERSITIFTLGCAFAAVLLTRAAGFAAGGILFLSILVGTILFSVVGGRHRVFFTAVFTSVIGVAGVVWGLSEDTMSWSDAFIFLPFYFFMYVLVPVAFAWAITLFIAWRNGEFLKHK